MHVKNKVLYHIRRLNPYSADWKEGTTINNVKKEPNLFIRFYDTHSASTDLTTDNDRKHMLAALEHFSNQPPEFKQKHYDDYLKLAYDVIKEQGTFIRETLFEEVRANYFPELPSRKSCIWLCEATSVYYWWSMLNGEKVIVKVSATGTLHHTDQKHLVHDTVSHDSLRSLAFNYWTGADGSNTLEEELLFEGLLGIKEIYQNVEEFKKKMQG